MAVRWTITFKTLSGSVGLVNVYDRDYSGTAIALTPAANPFFITRSQNDLITPVVSDSGYLRVIDNGLAAEYIDDLHPEAALDRPVEFYLDNELVWCGYISPASYTTPWESAPREVELPLVGYLDALDSINIADIGKGTQTIGMFLYDILSTSDFTFTGALVPRQMLSYDGHNDIPEIRLMLSRYNFLHLNEAEYVPDSGWTEFVGDSYRTILEEICRYFGWTASIQGRLLVLTSPRTDITTYREVSMYWLLNSNTLLDIIYTEVSRNTVTQLSWDGISHRRSILNGKKRITISTDTPSPEGIYPEILFNGDVEYDGEKVFSFNVGPSDYATVGTITGRNKVLNKDREHVTLHRYRKNGFGDGYTEIDWVYPTSVDDMAVPSAYILKTFSDGVVRLDGNIIDGSDAPTVKNIFKNALRLSGNIDGNYQSIFPWIVPLASVRSRSMCKFPAGSCIYMLADIQNSYCSSIAQASGHVNDFSGMTTWGKFVNYLKCSLRIGSYYYDGTTWGNSPQVFNISCGYLSNSIQPGCYKNGVGRVANRNEILAPYAGVEGYIIPIDDTIEGDVEITFYNWDYIFPSSTDYSFDALYISNLQFGFYKGSDGETKKINLSRLTGKQYQDELSVQLKLSSSNDNRISQALLWNTHRAVGLSDNITYPDGLLYKQPEQWLMNTLLKLYSSVSEQLVLEVDYDPGLNVYDLVSIGGKSYIITGCITDFAAEHTKLTIVSYE